MIYQTGEYGNNRVLMILMYEIIHKVMISVEKLSLFLTSLAHILFIVCVTDSVTISVIRVTYYWFMCIIIKTFIHDSHSSSLLKDNTWCFNSSLLVLCKNDTTCELLLLNKDT